MTQVDQVELGSRVGLAYLGRQARFQFYHEQKLIKPKINSVKIKFYLIRISIVLSKQEI